MNFKVAVTKISIYLAVPVFIVVALMVPAAESASWVVVWQLASMYRQCGNHTFIGRYDEWLVGNPRAIAFSSAPLHLTGDNLGDICGLGWTSWTRFNSQPDSFDFNCVATSDEISANSGNLGFYIGGLNANRVTIAHCYVAQQDWNLCDLDTYIREYWQDACKTFLECDEYN